MSHPWMPFYPGDYLADTVHLSTLEHGAYLMLIIHYWRHGGLPAEDMRLARIVRLPLDQWMGARPTLVEFFQSDWRHKRIDVELATTAERYQKRANAGRKGGLAPHRGKQSLTKAEAMLQPGSDNAEAGLNHPQPHSHPQLQPHQEGNLSGADALSDLSAEEQFWARLDRLNSKGISRSLCRQLLKLNGHDFLEANRALEGAKQARHSGQYLGAIVRRLQQSPQASLPGTNPHVPGWVNERRAAGLLVERHGKSWRCQGELLNDGGEVVGF
jgi:uncharacterized protein YdaU (DUF1376 family)